MIGKIIKFVSVIILSILLISQDYKYSFAQNQQPNLHKFKIEEDISVYSKNEHLKGLDNGAGAIARSLGYSRTNYLSHGQRVYKSNKNKTPLYITRDIDSHSGGYWKGAKTVKNLQSKKTRDGTYDKNLRRLGD